MCTYRHNIVCVHGWAKNILQCYYCHIYSQNLTLYTHVLNMGILWLTGCYVQVIGNFKNISTCSFDTAWNLTSALCATLVVS